MRGAAIVAWKDFKGYFFSPSYYVVAGLFTFFLGFTYFSLLNRFALESIRNARFNAQGAGGLNFHSEVIIGHISNINLVMLFFIPFLTVRLFCEEKKLHTFDLLLTSPVNATEIVLGKIFAGIGSVWVLVTVGLLYPVITSYFADIQWGPLLTSFAGLYLLTAVYVSIGVFCSSLTDSVLLAGVVSIVLSLCLWFVAYGALIAEDPGVVAVINYLAIANHFGELVRGNIQVKNVVFHVTVLGFFLFLTQRVVESARWR